MAYLFRGQDRRDLNKAIMSITRILSRDALAVNPKKTTAISTRQTVFDSPATYPGIQREQAQDILAVLTAQKNAKGTQAARFGITFTPNGAITAMTVISGGKYAGVPDDTYVLTIQDNGTGSGATANITIVGGIVTSVTLTAGGNLYIQPYAFFTPS